MTKRTSVSTKPEAGCVANYTTFRMRLELLVKLRTELENSRVTDIFSLSLNILSGTAIVLRCPNASAMKAMYP